MHENMLNSLFIREMKIQTTKRYKYKVIRITKQNALATLSVKKNCGAPGALRHWGQPDQESFWLLLTKSGIFW